MGKSINIIGLKVPVNHSQISKRFAVFVVRILVQDAEIAKITGCCDITLFNGGENGTTRFMCMCTVVEAAVRRYLENFRKIVSHLRAFKVNGAEGLHARRVDEGAAPWKVQQFAEGSCVHTLVVGVAHVSHFDMCVRNEQVDNGGLSHPAIA